MTPISQKLHAGSGLLVLDRLTDARPRTPDRGRPWPLMTARLIAADNRVKSPVGGVRFPSCFRTATSILPPVCRRLAGRGDASLTGSCPLEQEFALAGVASERRRLLDLGRRLIDPPKLREQVPAHTREQVVALELRLA